MIESIILILAVALSSFTATRLYSIEGFEIPESVQHDADLDLYFVSSITAHATRKDNTGYISRLRPDGTIESRKFIEGGRNGVAFTRPRAWCSAPTPCSSSMSIRCACS